MPGLQSSLLLCWQLAAGLSAAAAMRYDEQVPIKDRGICSIASAAPNAQFHCKYQGSLAHGTQPAAIFNSVTFDACRDACFTKDNGTKPCVSFSYAENTAPPTVTLSDSTSFCKLYDVPVEKQKTPTPPNFGEHLYWDNKCFNTNFYDFAPMNNGDFETNTLDSWLHTITPKDGNNYIHVAEPGRSSGYSAELQAYAYPGASRAAETSLKQGFTLCNGVDYILTFSFLQVPGATFQDTANLCQPSMRVALRYRDEVADRTQYEQSWVLSTIGAVSHGVSVIFPHSVPDGEKPNYHAGAWHDFSYDFTARDTGKWEVEVYVVGIECPSSGTRVRFDNIAVNAV